MKKEEFTNTKRNELAYQRSFFRAVEPCRKILESYKYDGDLLQSFHMTESDGSFLFRKQFDVTAKKILCKKEPDALCDFLNFLEKHNRCFLISIDEETLAIIQSKLQKSFPERLQKLKIKGFTYWKRSLRKLALPQVELEENINDASSKYCNALTITKVLKAAFYKIIQSYQKEKNVFSMYHHCLSIKKLKSPHRHRVKSCREEIVIDITSSFHNISSCITGRKMQQVVLNSDSETEVCERLPINEPQEYFEPDTKIKSEEIIISSDSEDGIEIIATNPDLIPARPVENVNPLMIKINPIKEGPMLIQCCFCNATCRSKNLLKHCKKVHRVEMTRRCTEAYHEFLWSGPDGNLEEKSAISFIHNKHKEIPHTFIKDFVQVVQNQARQQAALQAQAMNQFQNQKLACIIQNQNRIDELRLKIDSIRTQINVSMVHPTGSGYNIDQLCREEVKLQEELNKYL